MDCFESRSQHAGPGLCFLASSVLTNPHFGGKGGGFYEGTAKGTWGGSVPSSGSDGKAKAAAGTAAVTDGDGPSAAVLGLGLVTGRPQALFRPLG